MARRVLVAAFILVSTVLVTTPARAAVVCAFDGTTKTATVTLDNGDVATVIRAGTAIEVNATPCGDVNTVDTIDVSSTGTAGELRIDLSGGAFAPGATAEADAADSEIEWLVDLLAGTTLRVVGSTGADHVVAGEGGINLNPDEASGDVDVVITGAPNLVLEGGDGDDVLSTAGGAGTGTDAAIATLSGGPGSDVLLPGTPGSTVDGGDGPDTVSYAGAIAGVKIDLAAGEATRADVVDTLVAIENANGSPGDDTLLGDNGGNSLDGDDGNDVIDGGPGDDTLDGGAGTDTVQANGGNAVVVDLKDGIMTGQGTDAVAAFENVKGSDGNDQITGNGEANVLDGGAGNDRVDGRTGPDDLRGGAGNDTVSFGSAKHKMEIDLREGGGATGAGDDTLAGFENVEGSPKDDVIHGADGANVLDGRSGIDEIYGHDGKDRLIGGNGSDLLFGNGGSDTLLGDDGRDQLDGGQGNGDVCKGGADPDAFVNCENIHTSARNGIWYLEAR